MYLWKILRCQPSYYIERYSAAFDPDFFLSYPRTVEITHWKHSLASKTFLGVGPPWTPPPFFFFWKYKFCYWCFSDSLLARALQSIFTIFHFILLLQYAQCDTPQYKQNTIHSLIVFFLCCIRLSIQKVSMHVHVDVYTHFTSNSKMKKKLN